jgi:hypothetical protein
VLADVVALHLPELDCSSNAFAACPTQLSGARLAVCAGLKSPSAVLRSFAALTSVSAARPVSV